MARSAGRSPPGTKTPASILAGAAQEVAKSTRSVGDPAVAKLIPTITGGASAAARSGNGESLTARSRDTVSFEPESIPKFDLDFNLEEPSRPGPSFQPIPMPVTPKSVAPQPVPEPALVAVGALFVLAIVIARLADKSP